MLDRALDHTDAPAGRADQLALPVDMTAQHTTLADDVLVAAAFLAAHADGLVNPVAEASFRARSGRLFAHYRDLARMEAQSELARAEAGDR